MDQIRQTAGIVWNTLEESGPMSMAKLINAVDALRDVIMQGLGWLAREDKIEIDETNRSRAISLR